MNEESRRLANARQRRYYARNKERLREWRREYYRQNVEREREYNRQYGEANAGKVNDRCRNYRKEHRDEGREYERHYRARHPERARAKDAVSRATRAGRLIPQPCERCGREPTHAHHDDYSKRLDVRWLCARCHSRHHARHRVALSGTHG